MYILDCVQHNPFRSTEKNISKAFSLACIMFSIQFLWCSSKYHFMCASLKWTELPLREISAQIYLNSTSFSLTSAVCNVYTLHPHTVHYEQTEYAITYASLPIMWWLGMVGKVSSRHFLVYITNTQNSTRASVDDSNRILSKPILVSNEFWWCPSALCF